MAWPEAMYGLVKAYIWHGQSVYMAWAELIDGLARGYVWPVWPLGFKGRGGEGGWWVLMVCWFVPTVLEEY